MSNASPQNGSFGTGETQDDSWVNELSGTVTGPSIQARSIQGGIQFNLGRHSALPVPAQLPFPALFANRDKELADLDRLTAEKGSSRPALVVITGAGGVGKTTLGLYWL
ncbi:MAG TPA: ATP-binding protein, partial [Streptosporangiaceae bacterium]